MCPDGKAQESFPWSPVFSGIASRRVYILTGPLGSKLGRRQLLASLDAPNRDAFPCFRVHANIASLHPHISPRPSAHEQAGRHSSGYLDGPVPELAP